MLGNALWVALYVGIFSMSLHADNPGTFRALNQSELAHVERSVGLDLPDKNFERLEGYEQDVWGKKAKFIYAVSHPTLYSGSVCRYFRWRLREQPEEVAVWEDEVQSFAAVVGVRDINLNDFSCSNYKDKLHYVYVESVTDEQIRYIMESLNELVAQGKEYIYKYRGFFDGWLKDDEIEGFGVNDIFEIKISEIYYHQPLIDGYSVDESQLRSYPLIGTISYRVGFYSQENRVFYTLSLSSAEGELRVVGVDVNTLDGYPIMKTLGLKLWGPEESLK